MDPDQSISKVFHLLFFLLSKLLSFTKSIVISIWESRERRFAGEKLSWHQCFFLSSSHFSLEPIILLNILIRQQSFFILNIRMLRLYGKKTTFSVFLKVYWPERLSPYQLMRWFVAIAKSDKAKSSLFYTIFSSYEPNFKMLPFQHFQAYGLGFGLADDLHKTSRNPKSFIGVFIRRLSLRK